MPKTAGMSDFLEAVMPGRKEAMATHKCVFCGSEAAAFKDELSAKEFEISGLCQKCQDETFSGGE